VARRQKEGVVGEGVQPQPEVYQHSAAQSLMEFSAPHNLHASYEAHHNLSASYEAPPDLLELKLRSDTILCAESSTLNPQLAILNPQPLTFNPQPSTLNPEF
jgi:hypothetical protein